MKRMLFAVLASIPIAAGAADGALKGKCSTQAAATERKSELIAQAKVAPVEAQKIALESAKAGKVVRGGIGLEDGCLVYTFRVKNEGDKDETKVLVDAGDGKVLAKDKEGATPAVSLKPADKSKDYGGRSRERVTSEPPANPAVKK